jgi:hypothetical protein
MCLTELTRGANETLGRETLGSETLGMDIGRLVDEIEDDGFKSPSNALIKSDRETSTPAMEKK